MSYSPRKRDRYRLAVAAVSGLATFGALTASGLIAGAAAQGYEADQAATTAQKKAELIAWKQAKVERKAIIKASKKYYAQLAKQAAHPKVIVRQRPQETHVTTQYLSSGGSGYVGSGGNVYTGGSTSYGGGTTSSGGGTTSSGGGTSSGGTSAPPPPPPPPPNPPSTGS